MAAGRIGEKLKSRRDVVFSFEGTCARRFGVHTARAAVYLLRRGLRAHGRTHDFSHAELLSGNAAEVSDRRGDGAGKLLCTTNQIRNPNLKGVNHETISRARVCR